MISPEAIKVELAEESTSDYGERVIKYRKPITCRVIVAPGATSGIVDGTRDGEKIAYTLHFPKEWAARLVDARIEVRGELCRVIGEPAPYTVDNTPGLWNLPVEVTRCDG